MQYLLIANIVILLMLGVIWNKKDWKNFFVKYALLLCAGANIVFALMSFGFIIRGM